MLLHAFFLLIQEETRCTFFFFFNLFLNQWPLLLDLSLICPSGLLFFCKCYKKMDTQMMSATSFMSFWKMPPLLLAPISNQKVILFNNNTIATTSTNMKLYLVSKFSQFAHEQYHQINFWNWVYYWMNIKYIDETYLYINRIYN